MGLGHTFLMAAAAVSLHELAHILAAKSFGCKVRQLRISALGEMAFIPQMKNLSLWKRTMIIAAGPACNLINWLVFRQAGPDWNYQEYLELFAFYNLILCGFNMLPIFPLDGAKLLQLLAGNRMGVARTNRLALRMGKICCGLLIALGVVQAIMFAPNFTMLLVGFILWRKSKDIQVELMGEFYMAMMNKTNRLAEGPLPSRLVCAYSHQSLQQIVDSFGWDWLMLICLADKNNIIVSESKIMEHVLCRGTNGTLADCL